MKKVLSVFLVIVLFFTMGNTIANAELPSRKMYMKHVLMYDKETINLANKIIKYDKKNELECKSPIDLAETCQIIKEQSKYTKFDKYTVAAIVFDESKLNKDAYNKKDGGTGLMQLTGIKKYHSDTLFWIKNPKDKHQNIIGGLIILEEMRRVYKNKQLVLKHFNGSCKSAERYARRIEKIKRELKANR